MIKQKLIISEDERKRILNLHESATKNQYLLKEQESTNKVSFNISKSFPSGQYNIIDSSEIDDAITKIQSLLKTGQGKFDTIIINSSESKVPNRGVGMSTGDLSKKRAEEVEKYIKSKVGDSINVQVNDLGPQGPEWDSSKGKDNPEYTKYQYVTLSLGAGVNNSSNIQSICDFNFTESGGQGLEKNNYITLNRQLKDYGNLSIDTGSIPDRMVVVNNENSIVSDTGYVATEPHQYEKFKYVPIYVYQLTLLNQVKKNSSVSGNKLITINVNTFEELLSELLVDSSKIPNNEEILRMGTEVSSGVKGLKNLVNKGIKTFVLYSIGGNEIGKVPFDSRKGDTKVMVYSPVGQTGYTITGNCPNQA
jgi:hypothetical protein